MSQKKQLLGKTNLRRVQGYMLAAGVGPVHLVTAAIGCKSLYLPQPGVGWVCTCIHHQTLS